jgi:hypothetical protein
MSSLRELQTAFTAGVYGAGGGSLASRVRARGLSGSRRLTIYRNNTRASLTAALRDIYSICSRLVGGEFFDFAASRYIAEHPPATGNLLEFGGQFARFIATFSPAAELVYLADVARLEWARHEVFHAAAATELDYAALARVPQDRYAALRFKLHPASRLVRSEYPLLRICEVSQPDCRDGATVDLAEGGVRLLLIRRDLVVELEPLSEGDHAFLSAAQKGEPLTQTYLDAAAAEPSFELQQRLGWYIASRIISGFSS